MSKDGQKRYKTKQYIFAIQDKQKVKVSVEYGTHDLFFNGYFKIDKEDALALAEFIQFRYKKKAIK